MSEHARKIYREAYRVERLYHRAVSDASVCEYGICREPDVDACTCFRENEDIRSAQLAISEMLKQRPYMLKTWWQLQDHLRKAYVWRNEVYSPWNGINSMRYPSGLVPDGWIKLRANLWRASKVGLGCERWRRSPEGYYRALLRRER